MRKLLDRYYDSAILVLWIWACFAFIGVMSNQAMHEGLEYGPWCYDVAHGEFIDGFCWVDGKVVGRD